MNRSTFLHSLRVIGLVACAGLAVQACASGSPTGKSSSELGGGSSGSGSSGSSSSGSSGSGSSGSSSSGSGSSGSGSSGSGSGYAYGYAFDRHHAADRHHVVSLASGASETIAFTWHDAAGIAPPADLWIESAGKMVLQVAAVDGAPFLRSGLDVVSLVDGASYTVVFTRVGDSVLVDVKDSADQIILSTETAAPVADFVLPALFFRASIVARVQ
jgi:hypothetical protein